MTMHVQRKRLKMIVIRFIRKNVNSACWVCWWAKIGRLFNIDFQIIMNGLWMFVIKKAIYWASSNYYMYFEFQTLSLHFGYCCWHSPVDAWASSYILCSTFSADSKGSGRLQMLEEKWKIEEKFDSFEILEIKFGMSNFLNTYVKTVRSSSITILPGSLLCLRCPVSQSIFRIHWLPSLPCLQMNAKKKVIKFAFFLSLHSNRNHEKYSESYVLRKCTICLYKRWRERRCKFKSNFSNGVSSSMLRFLNAGWIIWL